MAGTYIDCREVVALVKAGEPRGMGQLYTILRMIGPQLRKLFGHQWEDRMHDLYLIVVDAIRSDKVRDPVHLFAYIRGCAHFKMSEDATARNRREQILVAAQNWKSWHHQPPTPADELLRLERLGIAQKLMAEVLSADERRFLVAFYFSDEARDKIKADMGMTEVAFRLRNMRSKQKLARAFVRFQAAQQEMSAHA